MANLIKLLLKMFFCSFFQRRLNALQTQNILLKLIYIIYIIVFKFVKTINKKQLFISNTNSLSIKLYFLILLIFLLFFNLI